LDEVLWRDTTQLQHTFRLADPTSGRVLDQTIEIQGKTEDRMRYDAREKALRDQQWALAATHLAGEQEGTEKGKAEGEVKLIRILEGLLNRPAMAESELALKRLVELSQIAGELQRLLRSRPTS
jgi:hypothetical protein